MDGDGRDGDRGGARTLLHGRPGVVPGFLLLLVLTVPSPAAVDRAPMAGTSAGLPVASLEHRVYTLLDYYESGRRAVDAFTREGEATGATPNLTAIVRRCRGFSVQLEIRFDRGGSRIESAVATGVLIDAGRRVLTAGHSFEGTGAVSIVVKYLDGATRKARLIEREYDRFATSDHDWAILEVADPPSQPGTWVVPSPARVGETVVVLGYPDEIGIDATGKVAYTAASDAGHHEPLTAVAIVDRTSPLLLRPWVGSIPTRGMSGAPVFNLSGQLLGIFVAVNSAWADGGVTHAYEACSTGSASGPRVFARDPQSIDR